MTGIYALLTHAVFKNPVNTSIGLAPNEIRLGRVPRLPITAFKQDNIGDHQSLYHDQLTYRDNTRELQNWGYDFIRDHRTATTSRLSHAHG